MHSYEPCMCGDPACFSCGPAQGFSRCEAHGVMDCDSCVDAGDAELPTAPEGGEHDPDACPGPICQGECMGVEPFNPDGGPCPDGCGGDS